MKKIAAPQGGFALILVLGLVTLIVAIIVAFLLNVSSERNASSGYASSVSARQLGDTAVSLVEAQINQATTYIPPVGVTNVAWTSQPGLIRTFDQDGSVLNLYKLYSAGDMVTPRPSDINADLPSADWPKNGALWVDMNARAPAGIDPVTGKENYLYPIFDPRAATKIDGMNGLTKTGDNGGFYVDTAAASFTNVTASTDGVAPAPMPVRWLYVLQNGDVVVPTAGTANQYSVKVAETAANPVIGRIAFWTDDETSKVNVNTASEGTFWDTPHGYTTQEVYDLAVKQPAKGEYQRYPGHPATVSLSAVLPGMHSEYVYSLIPRVVGEYDNPNGPGWTTRENTQIAAPVTDPTKFYFGIHSDGDRLLNSLDELMFTAKRAPTAPSVRTSAIALASSLGANAPGIPLTRDILESRRFFLTAHSRAPETNLFNLPRIATWPVYRLGTVPGNANTPSKVDQIDTNRTNAFDRAIALCSSLRGMESASNPDGQFPHPYFFQRQNSKNAFNDLGELPGSGMTGSIPRNLDLYKYLQFLTESKIPGFGGQTFLDKYGANRDEILTQMFDYVRCTNLYDDLLDFDPATGLKRSILGQYTFTNATDTTGHGIITPIRGPNGTMGQGRYYTLRDLTIHVIACAEQKTALSAGVGKGNEKSNVMLRPFDNRLDKDNDAATLLKEGETRVQIAVYPNFYTTMVGWRMAVPDMRVDIENLSGISFKDSTGAIVPANLPVASGFNGMNTPFILGGGQGAGGKLPEAWSLLKQTATLSAARAPTDPPTYTTSSTNYPFVGWPVTVKNTEALTIGGCIATVKIYVPRTATTPVQTFTVTIPSVQTPVPTVADTATVAPYAFAHSFYSDGDGSNGRLKVTNGDNYNTRLYSSGNDILRSVVLGHGDFRLISSAVTISDPTTYKPVPNYSNATLKPAGVVNATAGYLVRNAGVSTVDLPTASTGIAADFPNNAKSAGAAQATGDFDRGVGWSVSGAGANKPDEGDFKREPTNAVQLKDQIEGKSIPYYSTWNSQNPNSATYFSPNRMVPSPVMFGSLPSGARSTPSTPSVPWRTLLFRPLSQDESSHFGATAPMDHFLLDLFWMPVVDPYAISDRFSTAGKINLNHKIVPFSYLERTTALRAVLKAEKMLRIATSNTVSPNVNSGGFTTIPTTDQRFDIDADQMMSQFDSQRFADPTRISNGRNVFISPSEICEMYLTPMTLPSTRWQDMAIDWNSYKMTGDNMREKIYATVYQKLTTKSNTFTVHFRAQSLKRVPGSEVGTFTHGRDAVLGEYRGSTVIERYIDPAASIPDYAIKASNPLPPTLDHYYKWRVVQNTQFAP